MFLFINVSTQSVFAKAPLDEHGELIMKYVTCGKDIFHECEFWSSYMANIPEDYIKRFGAYPRIMIWDDVADPVRVVVEVQFKRKSNPNPYYWPPEPDYPLNMTWGDIKKYFYWRMVSYKTGEIKYLPLELGDNNKGIVQQSGVHSWRMLLNFDGHLLPVPNDGSAWKVSLDMYEEEPYGGNVKALGQTEQFDFIRTVRSTPLDTLRWAEHSNYIMEDKALNRRMLGYFPHSRVTMDYLINYFFEEKNADSLEYFGRMYIQEMKDRLDPHYARYFMSGDSATAPRPITHNDYDFIQSLYKRLTGDTLDLGVRDIPPLEEVYNSMEIEIEYINKN